MHTTGEKPGKGTYKCTKCWRLIVLDDDDDTLLYHPKCGHFEFIRVE